MLSVQTHDLQKWQVANPNIVIGDLMFLPTDLSKVCLNQSQAFRLVVDNLWVKIFLWSLIKTVIKLSGKQIHSHDAENQPEDQTHQQNVKDGGDRSNQGVYHYL